MKPYSPAYFKNLDALRFAAFVLVFISHAFVSYDTSLDAIVQQMRLMLAPYAFIGVSFFFTLSSFLITWIILNEYELHQQFNLKNFYLRRALRIWPLYFLILFIGYAVVPLLNSITNTTPPHLPNVWWFLTFTINFYLNNIDRNILFLLSFLWSIAVEEQFYLLWGFLLRWFKKYFLFIVLSLSIAYAGLLLLYTFDVVRDIYFNPINYFIDFSMGAGLAYSGIYKNKVFHFIKNRPQSFWKSCYVGFALILTCLPVFQEVIVTHIVFTIWYCLLLFDQCFNTKPVINFGKFNFINYLGKISYGLYCWHGVIISFTLKWLTWVHYKESSIDVLLWFPLFTFGLTVITAMLSYRFFESRFLKLKQYFSPHLKEQKTN